MTSTVAFLSRSTRSFLFLLPALAPLQAEIVEFNLDQVPMPASGSVAIASPQNEQGLRLENNSGGFFVVGPASQSFTGVKAFVPAVLSTNQPVNMQLYSPTGRPFALRSVTLHPYIAGTAVNVAFTGWFNGNGWSQSHSTGTALAGRTVTFNSNFDRIGALQWQMQAVGGVYQRFQISRIVVEFDGVLSTPSEIVVNEAAGTASIPIRLAHPRTTDTELIREVAGLTATEGSDFTLPGGTNFAPVIIPAGQTVAYVQVPLTNDTATEGIETFKVGFSANTPGTAFAGGATYADCTVKIASDDGVTTFPNWMTAHGLTSTAATAEADPNGDGISNIECWLFRLNPAGPNPPAWMARRAVMNGGSVDPGLRFVVPTPLPSDVRIILSQSTSLGAWTEQTRRTGFGLGSLWTGTGSARVMESNNLTGRTITLRASVPTGQRPRLFLRNTYEYVSGGGAS